MSRVFHGLLASSGPMYISYRRNVSAPNSAMMSSGLTTFFRLFDILAMICVTALAGADLDERAVGTLLDLVDRDQRLVAALIREAEDQPLVEQLARTARAC